jgi:hypothetical protein
MSYRRRRNAFIYTIPLHRANLSMYLLLELMTVLRERSNLERPRTERKTVCSGRTATRRVGALRQSSSAMPFEQ